MAHPQPTICSGQLPPNRRVSASVPHFGPTSRESRLGFRVSNARDDDSKPNHECTECAGTVEEATDAHTFVATGYRQGDHKAIMAY